jgi:hypothetical protein
MNKCDIKAKLIDVIEERECLYNQLQFFPESKTTDLTIKYRAAVREMIELINELAENNRNIVAENENAKLAEIKGYVKALIDRHELAVKMIKTKGGDIFSHKSSIEELKGLLDLIESQDIAYYCGF